MENETKSETETVKENGMDSWEGFLGSVFLGVDDVDSEQDEFICVNVELDTENNRPLLVLQKDAISHKFGLNVTNSNFVKDLGIKSPRDIIGKKIFFRKTIAFSPKSKKDVPALRILKIEAVGETAKEEVKKTAKETVKETVEETKK